MALTESTMLSLGTIAPDFALTDVISGKTIRRDDFRGQKGLLVLFICAHCPYVKHIEKSLGKLSADYDENRSASSPSARTTRPRTRPTAPPASSGKPLPTTSSSPISTMSRRP